MSQDIVADAIVVDANVLISISSREDLTYQKAEQLIHENAEKGSVFCAPNIIVAEVLNVLCRKFADGLITKDEHLAAVEAFNELASAIVTPEDGDAALVPNAERIRSSYGCSRTADSLYLAYAEQLAKTRRVELLTLDAGMVNHASKCSPTVSVNMITI
ncbi:MAG: type II toxin-antitoxin system VapC family toxin [Blastocatellia bacterium]